MPSLCPFPLPDYLKIEFDLVIKKNMISTAGQVFCMYGKLKKNVFEKQSSKLINFM